MSKNKDDKSCYLEINGKKYGPISENYIILLYNEKKINADVRFLRKGTKKWVTLAKSDILTLQKSNDIGVPPLKKELLNATSTSESIDKPKESIDSNSKGQRSASKTMVAIAIILVLVTIGMSAGILNIINNTTEPVDNSDSQFISANAEDEGNENNTEIPEVGYEQEDSFIPDNYDFALLDMQANNEEFTYILHNNMEQKIQTLMIKGKWIDKDGVIVSQYTYMLDDILENDKIQFVRHIPVEAVTIRLETMTVGIDDINPEEHSRVEYDLMSIIPSLSVKDLERWHLSYYIDNDHDLSNEAEAENKKHNESISATNEQIDDTNAPIELRKFYGEEFSIDFVYPSNFTFNQDETTKSIVVYQDKIEFTSYNFYSDDGAKLMVACSTNINSTLEDQIDTNNFIINRYGWKIDEIIKQTFDGGYYYTTYEDDGLISGIRNKIYYNKRYNQTHGQYAVTIELIYPVKLDEKYGGDDVLGKIYKSAFFE